MKIQSVDLRQPYSSLTVYQSDSTVDLPGIVIIPGGSYNRILDRDSERVALTFATHAFESFVVHYPILEHKNYQDALTAISQAFDYITDNAKAFHVDPNKLGIIGFSAGGQLAAAYSNQATTKAKFAALGYPVIQPTIDDKMGVHTENVAKLVTDQTPRTFLWGSINDGLTPYLDHVAVYAKALASHHVPFELHEFATGNHGMALANEYTAIVNKDRQDLHLSRWFPLFLEWLKS